MHQRIVVRNGMTHTRSRLQYCMVDARRVADQCK
jgi:hypothetical protein